MPSKVLELTRADSAMVARCQTLQVHHDGIVEHGHRQNVIREEAAEEMSAHLQKATKTLEVEVGVLRSEKSE